MASYQAPYERIDWDAPRTAEEWTALAAELREQAKGNRQAAADSFERCDTDGFMSQWASNVTAGAYELAASIAEDHGWIERPALFTLDGTFLTAVRRDSQNHGWGMYWDVPAAKAAQAGLAKRYVNESKARGPVARAKAYAKKGVAIGTIRIRPYVTLGGSSTNVSAYAEMSRDHLERGDFEVVSTKYGDRFDSTADSSRDWRCWSAEELAAALG